MFFSGVVNVHILALVLKKCVKFIKNVSALFHVNTISRFSSFFSSFFSDITNVHILALVFHQEYVSKF